jgi:RNA polymerase sigma-70 factor (ECF subfamily)
MPLSLPISLPSQSASKLAHPTRELIRRCLANDVRAQRTFFETHYRLVMGITSRYALDQQQAKDFLNQTFLKAFSSLDQFRGDGEIGGWLRTICVNVCLGQLRTRRYQPYAELPASATEVAEAPLALQQLALEDLVTLIQQLPPVPRAVFNLTAVEGFSHKEAGLRLGISEVTSRYHLRQARLRLQNALKNLNR